MLAPWQNISLFFATKDFRLLLPPPPLHVQGQLKGVMNKFRLTPLVPRLLELLGVENSISYP
jgi:hypothetical protein